MGISRHLDSGAFFKSAAFLRREFVGRSSFDNSRNELNDKTIVFFDTDLIVTYCEPWLMGSSINNPQAYGYGEVFPTSVEGVEGNLDPSKANDVSAILSEYCLIHVKSHQMPIYQFDEHFSETTQIYDNADYFARQENSRGSIPEFQLDERLRRASAVLASDMMPDRVTGDPLYPVVRYILNQLSGTTGHPQTKREKRLLAWERFVRLNALSGGIYPGKYVQEHLRSDAPPEVLNALELLTNGPVGKERAVFENLSQIFLKRLGQEHPKNQADANAIALLYLLNNRLKALGWRALFITGAKAVVEACYDDIPQFDGDNPSISHSFSEQFIRHFWAYTSEALIEPDLRGRRKFINWLDGLLARWSAHLKFDVGTLTDLVRNDRLENGLDQAEVMDAFVEWESLTNDAVSKYNFEAFGLQTESALKLQSRILSKIAESRNGGQFQPWSVVIEDLKEEYHRAKDRSFLELSGIGKASIWRTSGLGQRNPPDLAFGTLDNTNRIFRKLCHPIGYRPHEFAEDFESIKEDCHDSSLDQDDRQESHLKFLVLGAAFAGANKWGVALSQGKRAASIIERSRGTKFWPIPTKYPDSFMSGREAYFLCAAAMRMIARSSSDLDHAKQFLLKSEESLEEDWSHETAKRTTKVRLRGEDLALALSRYYLGRQNDEENFCDDLVPNIYAAAKKLLEEIKLVEPKGKGFAISGNFKKKFGKVTLVSVATNLVQVAVIRAFRKIHGRSEPTSFPVSEENLVVAVDLMVYFSGVSKNSPHSVKETALVGIYKDSGARLLGNEKIGYYKTPQERKALYKGKLDMDVAVYDDWRFKNLAVLADQLNKMSSEQRKTLLF